MRLAEFRETADPISFNDLKKEPELLQSAAFSRMHSMPASPATAQ
jgi:hypothetical protein